MYPTIGHLLHFRLPIPTFGCCLVLAFVVTYYTFLSEFRRRQLPGIEPRRLMDTILLWGGLSGFIVAILFAALEGHYGLNYYGGLLGGCIAYFYITARKGISFPIAADIGSPPMMLAYGVGRLGCHLAGDGDWGIVVRYPQPAWLPSLMWSSTYPHNVLRQGIIIPHCTDAYNYCTQLPAPVYPTPLYETILSLLFFGFLWALRRRIKTPGILFGIYALLNGTERFVIEYIRINPKYTFLGLTLSQAQFIALGWILMGIVSIGRPRKN